MDTLTEATIISTVASALQRAAEHRRLLPYPRFHALFDPKEPLVKRYAVLEKAVERLAGAERVDYGALLSLDNGLPGAEFFMRFKREHRDQYVAVMGAYACGQSVKKRRVLADAERSRVFDHAHERMARVGHVASMAVATADAAPGETRAAPRRSRAARASQGQANYA